MPEKPSSPCLSIGFPCTQLPSYRQPKGCWWAILGLVAAITRVFNIMGEEVLEAVVDESDVLASICGSCRCKTVSQGLPMVELEQFQCSLPPGSVSTHSGQCGVPTIAARCISHRSTLEFPSQCACFNCSVMFFFSRIRYPLSLPPVPPFPSFFCPACRKFMVSDS